MSNLIEAFTKDTELTQTEDPNAELVTDGQDTGTTLYDIEELWIVRDRPPYLV